MTKTIWKYDLRMVDVQEVPLPVGARILHVGLQFTRPKLWAMVDPNEHATELRRIVFHGTGHPIDHESKQYLATVAMPEGLVFHIFEERVT